MTVGDLANEYGLSKYAAIQIARSRIPGFARIHKGEAYGLTKADVAMLRQLFLAARPAPRPTAELAEIPAPETKTEEVHVMGNPEGYALSLIVQKTGIAEGTIKSLLSRHIELQALPYSTKAAGARVFFDSFIEWLAAHQGAEVAKVAKDLEHATSATRASSRRELPAALVHEYRLAAKDKLISADAFGFLIGVNPEFAMVHISGPEEAKASLEEGEKVFQKLGKLFDKRALR